MKDPNMELLDIKCTLKQTQMAYLRYRIAVLHRP